MTIDVYDIVIAIGSLVVISYFYNVISKKFNIPSALLLIATGTILKIVLEARQISVEDKIYPALTFLGIIGLILIVLEAAVELEIEKSKIGLVVKSFFAALSLLLVSSFSIALALSYFLLEDFLKSFIYAIPLSIISSAVLIPSVENLSPSKKEFASYESTFSDILGIIVFNLVVFSDSGGVFSLDSISKIALTFALSAIFSYSLVWIFAKLGKKTKLFFTISLLAILFAVGKKFHLSSLLLILIFGLILNNPQVFFPRAIYSRLDAANLKKATEDFRLLASETSFLIRTFFFVAFGMAIDFSSFANPKTLVVGTVILGIIYSARFVNSKFIVRSEILPEVFLAPRGLITILLFYSIPPSYQIQNFGTGILFFVIIGTSLIMLFALLMAPKMRLRDIDIENLGTERVEESETLRNIYAIVDSKNAPAVKIKSPPSDE